MRQHLLVAALFPLLACTPEGEVMPRPQGPDITELSHLVTTRAQAGAIALTVTRELHNERAAYTELSHVITVPSGAVVTGLRVGAEGGSLLDTESALARWAELISPGDDEPTTSGKLTWLSDGELELELFGIPPGATVSIAYDLQLPADTEDGLWRFDYPIEAGDDWALAHPTVELAATSGLTEEDEGGLHVRLPRAPIDHLDGKWALYPFGTGRTLWRLELDASPVLERAPVHASVVFVVDASHSEGDDGIAAQLELIAPYLLNAPDADVEIVVYRRFAERLFGRFVPASQVASALEHVHLTPANGSNLDLGAALAADALNGRAGPSRIVIFTDELLREGFTNDGALAALSKAPPDTVVHVVSRYGTGAGTPLDLQRNDEAPLAPIATASGGVFFTVNGEVKELLEGVRTLSTLVRPTRIDALQIDAEGLEIEHPTEFLEGATLRATALAEHPPREVTVRGKIWGRDVVQVLHVDAALTSALPALAIGQSDIERELTDDEVRVAANASGAVSRVTALLAARETARASNIGTARIALTGHGGGSFGCSCGGSFGTSSSCGGFFRGGKPPDYDGALRELLGPGLAACANGTPLTGRLHLEATGDELVDVTTSGLPPALAACVTEVAWAVRLTSLFSSSRSYELDLGR